MFVRLVIMLITLMSVHPSVIHANNESVSEVQAAFIREGNLFMLIEGEETQVTDTGKANHHKWSHDGEWISYQIEARSENRPSKTNTEIWVFNVKKGEKKEIYHNGDAIDLASHKRQGLFFE